MYCCATLLYNDAVQSCAVLCFVCLNSMRRHRVHESPSLDAREAAQPYVCNAAEPQPKKNQLRNVRRRKEGTLRHIRRHMEERGGSGRRRRRGEEAGANLSGSSLTKHRFFDKITHDNVGVLPIATPMAENVTGHVASVHM